MGQSIFHRVSPSEFQPFCEFKTFILLFHLYLFAGVVDSHVCILQESLDPASGVMRWSLPKYEICLCQGVVAPRVSAGRTCHRNGKTETTQQLWFTDDPSSLTNRNNWTPKKLDALLNRTHCCKCFL